jgi:hypothetical protein
MNMNAELASVIAAKGVAPMRSNIGRRRKVIAGGMALLLVPMLIALAMLPGQVSHLLTEPRYIPALFVASWRFETLQPLTLTQRFPWRYTIELGHEGTDLAIRFCLGIRMSWKALGRTCHAARGKRLLSLNATT